MKFVLILGVVSFSALSVEAQPAGMQAMFAHLCDNSVSSDSRVNRFKCMVKMAKNNAQFNRFVEVMQNCRSTTFGQMKDSEFVKKLCNQQDLSKIMACGARQLTNRRKREASPYKYGSFNGLGPIKRPCSFGGPRDVQITETVRNKRNIYPVFNRRQRKHRSTTESPSGVEQASASFGGPGQAMPGNNQEMNAFIITLTEQCK